MSHSQSASCSRVRAIGLSCDHACARAIVRACFHACVFLLVLACQATHGPHAARAYSSRKRKATTCGEARGVAFFCVGGSFPGNDVGRGERSESGARWMDRS